MYSGSEFSRGALLNAYKKNLYLEIQNQKLIKSCGLESNESNQKFSLIKYLIN